MQRADVVIIGAGVIGLSIAYNLAIRDNSLKILVLEKEKFHGTGATALCTGGIRHYFSSRTNAELTKISLPYFKKFNSRMQYPIYFRQRGYLFVTSDSNRYIDFQNDVHMLKTIGIPIELLSPGQIKERYPYINTEELLGGTFCSEDGYADPYGVTEGYYKQSRQQGVEVLNREPATAILTDRGQVTAVRTPSRLISTGTIINAAGAHANQVAGLAGIQIPVQPFRRQIHIFAPLAAIGTGIPLVVDIDTGFYVHGEKTGTFILGGTDKEVPPGFDTAVDWSQLDRLISAAIKRIPVFEDGKLMKAYVGLRTITPDWHGIISETAVKGFYCATGFSGHGFMHAPAIGILTAELILDGRASTMDISSLSLDRFSNNYLIENITF